MNLHDIGNAGWQWFSGTWRQWRTTGWCSPLYLLSLSTLLSTWQSIPMSVRSLSNFHNNYHRRWCADVNWKCPHPDRWPLGSLLRWLLQTPNHWPSLQPIWFLLLSYNSLALPKPLQPPLKPQKYLASSFPPPSCCVLRHTQAINDQKKKCKLCIRLTEEQWLE